MRQQRLRAGKKTAGTHLAARSWMTEPTRPMLVHFIFGLSDDEMERRFTFQHYVAVRAAFVHLQPCRLLFHHHHLPTGAHWPDAAALVELHKVELPRTVFNRPLKAGAHRADVLRLRLLIEHGGLYLDLDVVVLRPFHGLLRGRKSFFIGREGSSRHGGFHGLCNAVLLARPNSSFARRWLEEYRDFGDPQAGDPWSEHSVQRPIRLAAAHPEEVHVLPYAAFFWPDWDDESLRALVLDRSDALAHVRAAAGLSAAEAAGQPGAPADAEGTRAGSRAGAPFDAADEQREYAEHEEVPAGYTAYAVHLWSSLATPFVLRQWSPEYLMSVPSSLNCHLQASLGPGALAPPVPTLRGATLRRGPRGAYLSRAPLPWPGPPLPPLPAGISRNCSCASVRSGAAAGVAAAGTAFGELVAHWPLRRRSGDSARLLVDVSGRCHHGWVYSSCDGGTPGGGATSVGAASSFEAGCWALAPTTTGAGSACAAVSMAAPTTELATDVSSSAICMRNDRWKETKSAPSDARSFSTIASS